ncbi:hypothetical protein AB6A40_002969 [Gnathostoma spinigerum]|uniref:Calmodulin n=1 Tax=Gnathostoma spinigerum TaxID=75299 RepID=A0ABD6EIZ5_9BILA
MPTPRRIRLFIRYSLFNICCLFAAEHPSSEYKNSTVTVRNFIDSLFKELNTNDDDILSAEELIQMRDIVLQHSANPTDEVALDATGNVRRKDFAQFLRSVSKNVFAAIFDGYTDKRRLEQEETNAYFDEAASDVHSEVDYNEGDNENGSSLIPIIPTSNSIPIHDRSDAMAVILSHTRNTTVLTDVDINGDQFVDIAEAFQYVDQFPVVKSHLAFLKSFEKNAQFDGLLNSTGLLSFMADILIQCEMSSDKVLEGCDRLRWKTVEREVSLPRLPNDLLSLISFVLHTVPNTYIAPPPKPSRTTDFSFLLWMT